MVTEEENYGEIIFTNDSFNPVPVILGVGKLKIVTDSDNIVVNTYDKDTIVKGITEIGVTVYFIDQNLNPYKVIYSGDGNFTINIDGMSLGANKFSYYGVDSPGNRSDIRTITINVNTLPKIIYNDIVEEEITDNDELPTDIIEEEYKTLFFKNEDGPIVGAIVEINGHKVLHWWRWENNG